MLLLLLSMFMHLMLLLLLLLLLFLMLFMLMIRVPMSTVEYSKSDSVDLVYAHIGESTTLSSINKAPLR